MEVITVIGLIVVILIPILILAIGIYNFFRKESSKEILVKSAISFFLYFIFTFALTIFFMAYVYSMGNAIGHLSSETSEGSSLVNELRIVSSLVIFTYFSLGIGLCWFAKRNLSNSLSLIVGKSEKMPTLLSE